MTLPDIPVPGFESERIESTLVMARPEAIAWCREALTQHGSLHAAAMEGAALRLRGRGPVPVIDNPAGDGPAWVVRHYRRGGGMRVLDDRFLRVGKPRSLRELDSSVRVRASGVATPRVIAAAVYPSGVIYRADLVTEFVSDARELADVLLGTSDSSVAIADNGTRALALTSTDRLIADMVAQGIRHADLNARNILLTRTSQGMEAILLDLDRCVIREAEGPDDSDRLRQRLARSIRKLQATRPGEVSEAEMRIILEGVQP